MRAGRAGGFVTHVLMFDCWELCRMSVAPVLRRSGGGDAGSMGGPPMGCRDLLLWQAASQKNVLLCGVCVVRE